MAGNYFENLDKYLAPHEENRFLNGNTVGSAGGPNLSDPITPISKLGVTIVEKQGNGPANILQSIVANMRQGVGLMQLMIQTDINAPMGGGVSSVGKDARQAIKEMLKVSGVKMQGVELPTSTSNLNGFDGQRGMFSEKKRKDDIRHIKDIINFSAEVGFGGGVDNWSQEFDRNIYDASFKKVDKTDFVDFEGFDPNKDTTKILVNEDTGQMMQFSAQQMPLISVPEWEVAKESFVDHNGNTVNPGEYIDAEGNKLVADAFDDQFLLERVPVWDDKRKEFKANKMNWEQFQKYAQTRNEKEIKDKSKWLTAEEWFQRTQLEAQFAQQKGQSLQFSQRYQKQAEELKELVKTRASYKKLEEGKSEEELIEMGLLVPEPAMSSASQFMKKKQKLMSEILTDNIEETKHALKYSREISSNADAQAEAIKESMNKVKSVEKFAVDKTAKSYAELGIHAMQQTKVHNPDKPIHVGPELGWPERYGGHPVEFTTIIKKAREEMVNMMKKNPDTYGVHSVDEMKKLAKQHISGMLDTSHLSMWYNHFPKQGKETEEERLKRFNKWYMQQIDYLAKENVIGAVQVVDSMTGDHRHLPVGQGIFPTVDALKRLQKHGWDGDIISEGHEEDTIEAGRNQYALWSAFGASMGSGSGYFGTGGGNSFGNIYSGAGGAAGYRAPPNYIVGSYNPSNDWKLWSETPLE